MWKENLEFLANWGFLASSQMGTSTKFIFDRLHTARDNLAFTFSLKIFFHLLFSMTSTSTEELALVLNTGTQTRTIL